MDEITGAGFVSQDLYLHGYFSASIKLPADYTAGVVVAFYVSNNWSILCLFSSKLRKGKFLMVFALRFYIFLWCVGKFELGKVWHPLVLDKEWE